MELLSSSNQRYHSKKQIAPTFNLGKKLVFFFGSTPAADFFIRAGDFGIGIKFLFRRPEKGFPSFVTVSVSV